MSSLPFSHLPPPLPLSTHPPPAFPLLSRPPSRPNTPVPCARTAAFSEEDRLRLAKDFANVLDKVSVNVVTQAPAWACLRRGSLLRAAKICKVPVAPWAVEKRPYGLLPLGDCTLQDKNWKGRTIGKYN